MQRACETIVADLVDALERWPKERLKHPADIRRMAWNLVMASQVFHGDHGKVDFRLVVYHAFDETAHRLRDLCSAVQDAIAILQAADAVIHAGTVSLVLPPCRTIVRLLTDLQFARMFISDDFSYAATYLGTACSNMIAIGETMEAIDE